METKFKTSKILKSYLGQPTIYCPGCKAIHYFDERWTYNDNPEAPTFRPSMVWGVSTPSRKCHSFVTDGQIQFLDDCCHWLAGHTVPIPEIPDYFELDDE